MKKVYLGLTKYIAILENVKKFFKKFFNDVSLPSARKTFHFDESNADDFLKVHTFSIYGDISRHRGNVNFPVS